MKLRHLAWMGAAVLSLGASTPLLEAGTSSFRLAGEDAATSFRARVAAFWSWFGEHADEHREALSSRDPVRIREVKQAIDARLGELVPGLTFAADFGATPDSVAVNLVSGDDRTRQLLGRELVASMPALPRWMWSPWRPPADPTRSLGSIGSTDLVPRDFRVYCEWNGEETHLSLAVWHDGFPKLKPEDRQTLATRLVDRMLGAATAKRTPHTVTVLEKAPAADAEGVVAGDELYTTLVEFLKSENFDAVTPPEMVEDYYGPPSGEHDAGTRLGDLLSGASRYPDLVADFNLDMGTTTVSALTKVGATAGYVGFTHTIERVPLDTESGLAWIAIRKELASALDAKLTAAHAGTVVGFGDGAKRVWIDVLFFDESAALPIVRSVFAADARVTAAELYSFDRHELEPRTKIK